LCINAEEDQEQEVLQHLVNQYTCLFSFGVWVGEGDSMIKGTHVTWGVLG
jgi:hypothetical protein